MASSQHQMPHPANISIAHHIIDSITPASSKTSALSTPATPLPIADLASLPRDGSMLYGMGRIDTSGRISERRIVRSLDWLPGDRLDIDMAAHILIIRQTSRGTLRLTNNRCIALPSNARSRCNIEPGDQILLAASPEQGVLILHTSSNLDRMLIQFHSSLQLNETA